MRFRAIEKYKETLSLTSRQRQILVGSLLGDAHLESRYKLGCATLRIEHSYKQKEYVDWLHNEFKKWVRTSPRKKTRWSWGKKQDKYIFMTYGHKILGEFREIFYKNRKKIIPENLEYYLTPLSLAIWYMDDGSIKSNKHRGMFLNTQAFNVLDVEKLQKILEKKFSTKTVTRKDKNGLQIYILGKSAENFMRLIRSYIIPSMEYKIPKPLRLTQLPKK